MTENTMPAAEVAQGGDERTTYEFAFHVLPTVAEGEVSTVVAAVKAEITKVGGEIIDEEKPERVELAYEVVKHLEGRNRKFKTAYFGWVRFKAETTDMPMFVEEIDVLPELLRHILIKLTREEEANPFRFHEAMAAANMTVTTFDLDQEVVEAEAEAVVVEDAVTEDAGAAVDTKAEVA
jgi:ribosomal protein S6